MNPEELFEKLIKNQISREEFDRLLIGIDDEDVLARYEIFLQEQFEKTVNEYVSSEEHTKSGMTQLSTKKSLIPGKKSNRNIRFPGKLSVAAIFVFFIGTIFTLFFIISRTNKSGKENTQIIIEPQLITKTTPKGRMFRMNLEDGSFVHLNAVSTIIYPNEFAATERQIEIKGEAFFDIKRDESRPFNIRVKDFNVQVLGTSFNIEAYDDEEDFCVTVTSGTVKVLLDKEGANSVMLKKNQKLIYNPSTNITEILEVESEDELSWRQGILKFDSTPIAKVEKMVERWYGIDMVIADSEIYEKTLTGFHQNENLTSVIEAITFATGTKYLIKGNSIIIKQ